MALNLSSWVSNNVPIDEQVAAARQIRRTRAGRFAATRSDFWARTAHNYIVRCQVSVEGENGSHKAFRVACILMIGFNLSREIAFSIFQTWNRACRPPWSLYELNHTLDRAEIARESAPNPGYLRENLRRNKQRTA